MSSCEPVPSEAKGESRKVFPDLRSGDHVRHSPHLIELSATAPPGIYACAVGTRRGLIPSSHLCRDLVKLSVLQATCTIHHP